jgi:hypothetical protein
LSSSDFSLGSFFLARLRHSSTAGENDLTAPLLTERDLCDFDDITREGYCAGARRAHTGGCEFVAYRFASTSQHIHNVIFILIIIHCTLSEAPHSIVCCAQSATWLHSNAHRLLLLLLLLLRCATPLSTARSTARRVTSAPSRTVPLSRYMPRAPQTHFGKNEFFVYIFDMLLTSCLSNLSC